MASNMEDQNVRALQVALINHQQALFKQVDATIAKLKQSRGKKTKEALEKLEKERQDFVVLIKQNHQNLMKNEKIYKAPEQYPSEYARISTQMTLYMEEIESLAQKFNIEIEINKKIQLAENSESEDDANITVVEFPHLEDPNNQEGDGVANHQPNTINDTDTQNEKSVSKQTQSDSQAADKASERTQTDHTVHKNIEIQTRDASAEESSQQKQGVSSHDELRPTPSSAVLPPVKTFLRECLNCANPGSACNPHEIIKLHENFQALNINEHEPRHMVILPNGNRQALNASGQPVDPNQIQQNCLNASISNAVSSFYRTNVSGHLINPQIYATIGNSEIGYSHRANVAENFPQNQQYADATQQNIDPQITFGINNDARNFNQIYAASNFPQNSSTAQNANGSNQQNNYCQQFNQANGNINNFQQEPNKTQDGNSSNRQNNTASNAAANSASGSREMATSNNDDGQDSDHSDDPHRNRTSNYNNEVLSLIDKNQESFKQLSEVLINLTTHSIESQQAKSKGVTGLKPQKLEIQCFSGDVLEYQGFREVFNLAVKRSNFEELECFLLLRSKLRGRALERIAHLQLKAENYKVALKILDEEFLVTRVVLQSNLAKLRDIGAVKRGDVSSMRQYYSTLNTVSTNLLRLSCEHDCWLLEISFHKLEESLRCRFEDYIRAKNLTANVENMTRFLLEECSSVEAHQSGTKSAASKLVKTTYLTTNRQDQQKEEKAIICFICEKSHRVESCPSLLNSSNKRELLMKHKVCLHCLKHKHTRRACKSKQYVTCETCSDNHHTLLHNSTKGASTLMCQSENTEISEFMRHVSTLLTASEEYEEQEDVILPTAIVAVIDITGKQQQACSILDEGSQTSYVTERTVALLKLTKMPTNVNIRGINNLLDVAASYVILHIRTKLPPIEVIQVKALVLPHISAPLESIYVDPQEIAPSMLANANIGKNRIDLLLGSDVTAMFTLYKNPPKLLSTGHVAKETKFGYAISGRKSSHKQIVRSFPTFCSFPTFTESITKLLDDESLARAILDFHTIPESTLSDEQKEEEEYCEEVFQQKHFYDNTQKKYFVPILYKPGTWDDPANPPLGQSYRCALKCLLCMEEKFRRCPKLREMSNQFMETYIEMGHMLQVDKAKYRDKTGLVYYVPYLGIVRENALSTRYRSVFNASMKTSNGKSFNDLCLEGKTMIADLTAILTAVRFHPFFISADIKKMFRCFFTIPEDSRRLRILWRRDSSLPVDEFELHTVTYGTSSASFLASRTLQQCITDHCKNDQVKAKLMASFYVDDLVYGVNSIEEGQEAIKIIEETLDQGSMQLDKFMSNEEKILRDVKQEKLVTSHMEQGQEDVKLLGLMYNKQSDKFKINISKDGPTSYTKREFSRIAARIFDPLQWFLPYIMLLRLFLQQLWSQQLHWDQELPEDLKAQFIELTKNIGMIATVSIPRWLGCAGSTVMEIIGFADASIKAEAACLYSRIRQHDGKFHVMLIAARGKCAKIRNKEVKDMTATVPKMELDALVMLAELWQKVKKAIPHANIASAAIQAYTDSKVCLHWLRNPEGRTKFIRKRVDKISEIISPRCINHVQSELNPADIPSRSMSIEELVDCQKWWQPELLHLPTLPTISDEELKENLSGKVPIKSVRTLISEINGNEDMFFRCSTWKKIIRVTAILLRWLTYKKNSSRKASRNKGSPSLKISTSELETAKLKAIKFYQSTFMKDVCQAAAQKTIMRKGHWARKLTPQLDFNGIVRVDGRLGIKSILLPKFPRLLELIVRFMHLHNFHAGNSLTQVKVMEEYYATGLKKVVHKVISSCPICVRWRNRTAQQRMSELPRFRYEPAEAFSTVGTDLCGFFHIKESGLRFTKTLKVYVVVFVCTVTRAIHLEVVQNLTAMEYLLAFSRMTSRRGVPSLIVSDNASNLRSSARIIAEAHKKLLKETAELAAVKNLDWKFIPVQSPNFGGIYESAVKSFKYFIKRMKAINDLTLQEFISVVVKIEGLLNSRPLFTIDESTGSQILTPFHFLTARMYQVHAGEVMEAKLPLTERWLKMKALIRDYWTVFQSECYASYQRRQKWLKPEKNLKEGNIVIVKDNDLPPGSWKLGKVEKTYPDEHNNVRKVDILDGNKKVTNYCVRNLIPLLSEEEDRKAGKAEEEARQSVASRTRSKISVTQVLLTWLALTQAGLPANVECLYTTALDPGLHLLYGQNLTRQVDALKIQFNTQSNATADMVSISKLIAGYEALCTQTEEDDIKNYCLTWKTALDAKRNDTHNLIKQMSEERRHKRSLTLMQVGKAVLVIAPALTATGLYIDERLTNMNLQKQIEYNEKQLVRSIALLKNETGIRANQAENHLRDIENARAKEQVRAALKEQAEEILQIIAITNGRYETARVTAEDIKTQATELSAGLPHVKLPHQETEWFEKLHQEKAIQKEMLAITVNVPLVEVAGYKKLSIIAIPGKSRKIIALNNATSPNFATEIIIDDKNASFVLESQATITGNAIFEAKTASVDKCLSSILEGKSTGCRMDRVANEVEVVQEIAAGALIIVENGNVTLKCARRTYVFRQFCGIVPGRACSVVTKHLHMAAKGDVKLSSGTPTLLFTANRTVLPHLNWTSDWRKVDQQLEATLSTIDTKIAKENGLDTIVWSLGAIGTFIIIAIVAKWCRNPGCFKRGQSSTTPPVRATAYNATSWAELWTSQVLNSSPVDNL